ncbi:ABC transporter permease [Nitratireductor basaltis]|uniref:Acidobacterial duplicated orphan permease n=1 Tax=Nitratireductor basaltis TaxID=472175 RepID=A0A084U544_9HYPH|nr:FtsX-like permease family protein [Nitratireductor basaltis]KFB08080.1 acidobacterial duplicated orphan permease [Nitratireductor basaltis]
MLVRLAIFSLKARAVTVSMAVLTIALSVVLLLGVENIRTSTRASFADTISETDLIVGARSGPVQLLLYSIFRIGNATNNVTWQSYEEIAARPEVDWIVPISLGDSHRQFRVMGTTPAFFEHYKFRGGRSLSAQVGTNRMTDLYDTVIGADVARTLGYETGELILVAHGVASFSEHEDQPFRVAGILEKTGTPIDRTVIVSLEAIEAIHVNWQSGAPIPGRSTSLEDISELDLTPKAVTAALIGTKSRLQVFHLQRWINEYRAEPLLAVMPGLALQELWQIVGLAETALLAVSAMVAATALVGLVALTFSGLNERRREMAILRAMGARPATIVGLLVFEATLIGMGAVLLGLLATYGALFAMRGWVDAEFALWLAIKPPGAKELGILASIVLAAAIASLFPAWRAYRMSLADGMMVRI